MTTFLLLLLALAIGLGLGVLLTRRTGDAPAATEDAEATPDDSAHLLLCHRGAIEHEISVHGSVVPGSYTYAGKRFVRHGQRKDGAWEFRR